jgi:hypothetical protein
MNHRLPFSMLPQTQAGRQSSRHGRRLLLVLVLLLAWLPAGGRADGTEQTEYRVKAAFIYNFARFITWPELPDAYFNLCVLGSDPLVEQLDALRNKTVHERALRIMHLNSMTMLDGCQLVYVGRSFMSRLHDVISLLREQPVLTVSDIDDFIDGGGIIGLRLIDNRVRFEINTGAADTASLSISSKLLTLATNVRSGE